MKKKFPVLDIFRIAMVWGVVFFHINGSYPLHSALSFFSFGVFGCVAISGFLMGFLHGDEYTVCTLSDCIHVWKKKRNKFYFIHFLTFCMCAPITVYYHRFSYTVGTALRDAANAAANLLLIQSFVPVEEFYFGFNGVSWYLSTSLVLYFLSPFFSARLCRRETPEDKLRFCALVWAAVNVAMSLLAYVLPVHFLTYIQPLAHIPGYLLAMAVGMIYAEKGNLKGLRWNRLLLWGCLVLGTNFIKNRFSPLYGTEHPDSAALEAAALLCILLLLKLPCRGSRAVELLSESSFELFMVHTVVTRYMSLLWPADRLNPLLAAACAFVLSVLLSLALYALHRKKRLLPASVGK